MSLKCTECDLICNTEKKLWVHRKEAHEHKVCNKCGKEFLKRTKLNMHFEHCKVQKERPLECCHCGKKCSKYWNLDMHMKTAHNDCTVTNRKLPTSLVKTEGRKPKNTLFYRCGNCYKVFLTKEVYQNHLYSQAKGNFQCEFCSHVETNVIKLSSHELQSHCSDESREDAPSENESDALLQWICPRCKYNASGCADYQFHFVQTHFDIGVPKCVNFKEKVKSNKFVKSDPTKLRKRTQSVSSKSKIKEHKISSINTRNTKCEICDRVFPVFWNKVKHLKKCHDLPGITDKSKHLNCPVDGCTAYFLNMNQLAYHQFEKHNYKLDQSNIRISNPKVLNINPEFLQCPNCNKTVQGKVSLGKHMNSKFCPQNILLEDKGD